jgi:spermidine synthase
MNRKYLLTLPFLSGLCIMAVEITASRLLAPYFGSSLFVWTNIIGIVMLALSLGYHYGGKLADNYPKIKNLLILHLTAGIIFLLIPIIIQPVATTVTANLQTISSGGIAIFFGSLFLCVILFAFPLFLLAMTSPFVIRLSEVKPEKIGSISGNIFAISTIGSIIGTFLPTLWLIPAFGTKITVFSCAFILIIMASFGLLNKKWKILPIVILLLLPAYQSVQSKIKPSENLLAEAESSYQYIQVLETKGKRYLRYNEGYGFQSVYDPDQILTNSYHDYYSLLPYMNKKSDEDIAIIGLAGGTISNQLKHFFPEVNIEGIEIDSKVIKLAKKYMGLDPNKVSIINQDGRVYLRHTDNTYDMIIVDAYSQAIYIPRTLTTKEFWKLVKDRLTYQGVVAINVNSTSQDSQLMSAIENTMAKVFPKVYKLKTNADNFNYMLVAGKEIDLDQLREANVNKKLQKRKDIFLSEGDFLEYDSNEMILTDDRAPIEFLTDQMGWRYIF